MLFHGITLHSLFILFGIKQFSKMNTKHGSFVWIIVEPFLSLGTRAYWTGFPFGLENLKKWEGILQPGKSQGILNRLEKSGKITQNYWKTQGIWNKYYLIFLMIFKWTVYYLLKWIKLKKYWKMAKNTGKVREFCQSRKVGTLLKCPHFFGWYSLQCTFSWHDFGLLELTGSKMKNLCKSSGMYVPNLWQWTFVCILAELLDVQI